jgi:hypothetical protein
MKVKEEESAINHGDLSAFSSSQFEGEDDPSGSMPAPAPAKPKSSGWAWLNTIASVVTTGSTKGHRTAIDHDSESVLTRGGNYYDRSAGGGGEGEEEDEDMSSSPTRQDEDEEKTPERRAAEHTLAELFDAVTGRMSSPSAASPAVASPPTQSVVTYSVGRERDLTPAEQVQAHELLSTSDGRKSFSSVLNRQRNTSGGLKLSATALARLAALTRVFLDQAAQAMHVSPAQLVMIMSQSFYTAHDSPDSESSNSPDSPSSPSPSKGQEQRTYLIALVKGHRIWRDMRFWEEAFFDAFNSKIRKSAAARVHKWHSDLEQAESLHTRKQVCFSTLSTFIHNLSEFSLPPTAIVEFAEKLSSINELEPEQLAMLRTMPVYAAVNVNELDQDVASDIAASKEAHGGAEQDAMGEFESIQAENDDETTASTNLP